MISRDEPLRNERNHHWLFAFDVNLNVFLKNFYINRPSLGVRFIPRISPDTFQIFLWKQKVGEIKRNRIGAS